jgi:glycosyltransferase involved in cell wall biosynthesis
VARRLARRLHRVRVGRISRNRRLQSAFPLSVDVALDLPRTRQLSVGMRAYAEELAARLPAVAPDLTFLTLARTSALDRGEQFSLPARLRRARPRLVHFLSVYAPLAAPRPYVITVHDLIHLRFPAYFKRTVGPYYRTIVRAVCARAARVITDDERTVSDLERYLGVSARNVRIVPLGVDDTFLEPVATPQNARPYFVYAGNRRPHKNLAALFAAWEAVPAEHAVDLVLTGTDQDEGAARAALPRRAQGTFRYAGDVSTAELARLYRGATALVYPSLCEGFGLPMLEAAAVGTPVIASSQAVPGVLRAVVDVFEPHDVAALARLMTRALLTPSAPAAAQATARELTWDLCARRTADVYREVLAGAFAS